MTWRGSVRSRNCGLARMVSSNRRLRWRSWRGYSAARRIRDVDRTGSSRGGRRLLSGRLARAIETFNRTSLMVASTLMRIGDQNDREINQRLIQAQRSLSPSESSEEEREGLFQTDADALKEKQIIIPVIPIIELRPLQPGGACSSG